MRLLPLDKLGAREVADGVKFGIFLPWVSASDGNQLWMKIIHENDQFLQEIAPNEFELTHAIDPEYGDYWSVKVDIKSESRPGSWGKNGKYVYRYCLRHRDAEGGSLGVATIAPKSIGLLTPLPESLVLVSYRHLLWDMKTMYGTPKKMLGKLQH